MPILGLWDGHDAGAALIEPETKRILVAVNEERLTRRKLEVGFPRLAMEACLKEAGLSPEEVSDVAVSTYDFAKTLTRYFPGLKERYYTLRRRKRRPGLLDPLRRDFKYVTTAWKPNALTRALSRRALARELARCGLGSARLHLVAHHRAHAASAAYTSGFDTALVVTVDGVGDGLSGSISRLRDGGRLESASFLSARDSLGVFYELVTQLLNMRELEDEGKVMALAAYGYAPRDGANPLLDLFHVEGSRLRARLGPLALRRFLARELSVVPSEQFAWMAQRVLEVKLTELVGAALRETGERRLAYAGGVASNIKANLVLSELPELEELFVFPHMGDGGLALGAALAHARSGGFSVDDLRLGPRVTAREIEEALRPSGLRFRKPPSMPEEVATRIARDEIVFWFRGRMEYGPRALGARSILARPDRPKLRDRLNLELKRRVWYQPFCPSILEEDASRLLERGEILNRHMTRAYRVSPRAEPLLRGVVGYDGTCRPQMVNRSYGSYYDLLVAVKEAIGVGAVLNTSFNEHGEPIVARPEEALRTFARSSADALVLGDFLVEHPEGPREATGG